jgi:hypothetical protein
MTAPESVTATFSANAATQPTLTFSTNVATGEGAMIAVNSVVYSNTIAQPFAAGASVVVSITASFVSNTKSGIQYVFSKWSDGVTTASRTITAPSSSTSYQGYLHDAGAAYCYSDSGERLNGHWRRLDRRRDQCDSDGD